MYKDKGKTLYVAICPLIALTLLTGCNLSVTANRNSNQQVMLYENAMDEVQAKEVKTEKVIRGTYEETGYQNGTLEYLDRLPVTMDSDNAVFVKFVVEKGSKVKKGDVIAKYYVDYDRLNLVELKANAKNLEDNYKANLNSKKAEIAEMENKIKVMPNGAEKEITKAQLGKLKLDLKQFKKTEVGVKEAKKRYQDFLKETKKTKLLAPASGYVVEVGEFEEGDSVSNGTMMVAISNKKNFLITIPNEPGVSGINLRYNMEVKVKLGSSMNNIDAEMTGRIVSAPNFLKSGGSESLLYIEPIDPPEQANWDAPVYVEFERVRFENTLLVPYSAVMLEQDAYLESNNKYYVTLLEDGIQRKRYIICDRYNSDYYRVLEGLEEGQEVVVK